MAMRTAPRRIDNDVAPARLESLRRGLCDVVWRRSNWRSPALLKTATRSRLWDRALVQGSRLVNRDGRWVIEYAPFIVNNATVKALLDSENKQSSLFLHALPAVPAYGCS